MRTLLAAAAAAAMLTSATQAAEITRLQTPQGGIARGVVVPAGATTFYVSGIVPPPTNPGQTPLVYGDTKTQTINILKEIDSILKSQGFDMGDVVMMRVVLVGDPKMGGKMDFAGMNEGYRQFFGTAEQPDKPARITTQISALAGPDFLVEIEVQAAKMP